MRKLSIFIGSVFILFLIGGIGLWRWNKHFFLFWNSNTINVSCESPLSNNQVKIGWADEFHMHSTRHRPGHAENLSDYTVVFDKHATGMIGNEYGPNGFFITYGDKFYYEVEQMKLNWRFQHNYNFYFYQKGGKIFIKGDFVGADEMQFDAQMKENYTNSMHM